MKTLILLLVFFVGLSTAADTWSYKGEDGPKFWKDSFPLCGEGKQSPIDIYEEGTRYAKIGAFNFNDAYDSDDPDTYLLKNNGHSIVAEVQKGSDKILTKGGLKHRYKLLQFHMHWGIVDGEGSEHAFNNRNTSMEVHLVHMNIDSFNNFADAVQEDEGLAVIGIMVEVGRYKHYGFQKLIDFLDKVKYSGDTANLNATFSIMELFPCSTEWFYRYEGSLTTPPCAESVVWSIFKEHISISSDQMEAFRNVYFNKNGDANRKMVGNHRPLQKLGNRLITRSFLKDVDLSNAFCLSPSVGLLVLLFLLSPLFNFFSF